MRVFIELPTWLGDSVMATPAIENLLSHFNDSQVVILGSIVSVAVLKNHPKVTQVHLIEKNYFSLLQKIRSFDEFDFYFSFRSSIRSTFIKICISSKNKYQFNKIKYKKGHQVEKYNNFINDSLNINSIPSKLLIHSKNKNKVGKRKLLGLNPGASYGSSKRWYPKEFADIACALSSHYDIIIFGGPNEKDIAEDIEKYLIDRSINNYINLSAKTSINELISHIETLDLFITGDSGPMHLAAAYQIPTVAIFGPTNDNETSQWMNENSFILKQSLDCQPCMKRTCPLNHHKCMKLIKATDVLDVVNRMD